MTAHEVIRRGALGALIVVHLVVGAIVLVSTGEAWVLIAWSGFTIVGALILMARTGLWIGRLMLFVGLGWVLGGLLTVPSVAQITPVALELVGIWLGYALWLLVPLIALVFPSGEIATRLGWVVFGAIVAVWSTTLVAVIVGQPTLTFSGRPNPLAMEFVAPMSVVILGDGTFAVVPAIIAASLVEVILRWRRATGAQALQFRWFAFGTAVTAATVAIMVGVTAAGETWLWIFALAVMIGVNGIPIAVGIAVTRHGLYEIGRVVSRTVSYAIVTVLVVGVYAAVVTSVTWLLPDAPAAGVALATLVAAAVFLPVLRFVQRRIDRRFDRERFDAQQVVTDFGERLRTGNDPAATADDLVDAIERTLQPGALGIWTTGARS